MKRATKKTGSIQTESKPSSVAVTSHIEVDGRRERISCKAYELWEQRGRREGDALQDWLDAETIVRNEMYEARQ